MSYLNYDSHLEEELVSNDFNQLCWWDKARPRVSFRNGSPEERRCDTIDSVIICNYHIWVLFEGPCWNPIGSISFYQENHLKRRSVRKWGRGESWYPCQAGPGVTDGCFPPRLILLSCLFQNRFAAFKTVPLSAVVRKANIWGLKGELAGPRAGGRRGRDAWAAHQTGPGSQRGHLASNSFTL